MYFRNLLNPDEILGVEALVSGTSKGTGKAPRGCDACPLDGDHHKFIQPLTGAKIVVVFPAPGQADSQSLRPGSGASAALLWEVFEEFGVSSTDCDIQYSVRCYTGHKPIEKELYCCGLHTDRMNKGCTARIYLLLGIETAKQFLGQEYRGDRKALWSKRLQAFVVMAQNPAYFLKASNAQHEQQFENALEAVSVLQNCRKEFSILRQFDYKELTEADEVLEYFKLIAKSGERLAVDIEDGSAINPRTGVNEHVMLSIAICHKPGTSRVIFIDHPKRFLPDGTNRKKILYYIKRLMENPKIKKSFHHGIHEEDGFQDLLGIKLRGFDYDTEYAVYFDDPNRRKCGLKFVANNMFPEFTGYKELPGKYYKEVTNSEGKEVISYATVPPAILGPYNCADADVTKRLEMLTSENISMALMKVYILVGRRLDRMQHNGPLFDYGFYDYIQQRLPARIKRLGERIRRVGRAGGNPKFNPASPTDVAWLIYDHYEQPLYKDKKGKETRSTAAQAMELLKIKYANTTQKHFKLLVTALDDITRFRELSKLQGTYLLGFKKSADIYNGLIRTIWWLTGTITGRLRSGGGGDNDSGIVNLQNVSNDPEAQNLLIADRNWRRIQTAHDIGEDPEEIVRQFGDVKTFLALDYSGIEVRILAEMAGDPLLTQFFIDGKDVHSMVGQELTGIPVERIIKEKTIRVMIKGFHFGLIYGQQPAQMYEGMKASLAEQGLHDETLSVAKVQGFQDTYFERFPKVADYIKYQHQFAEDNGYVETMFGFRRPIDTAGADERGTFWKNQAINSPIQGSAHQLLLMAMAVAEEGIRGEYKALADQPLEIHDSMVFRTPLRDLPSTYKTARHLLDHAVVDYIKQKFGHTMKVPLVSDGEAGFRLGVMVKDDDDFAPEIFIPAWCKKNTKVDEELDAKYKTDKEKKL